MSDSAKGAGGARRVTPWRSPDARRLLQLALATVWLLDGVLQLQPFFFTGGPNGFSGMLAGTAAGNPRPVAHSIPWNASVVDHHAVVTNTVFAFIQILSGFGIAWRPSLKPALAASIVWSLGVWWFGEGLGGVLQGTARPIAGGPGAVLFYALLAVLLWPADGAGAPHRSRRPGQSASARPGPCGPSVWVGLAVPRARSARAAPRRASRPDRATCRR